MRTAFIVLLGVAASLAWVLARRRPDHRPIAWLLSAGFFGDVAQWAIDVAVVAPLRAELGTSVPWTGWARFAGHLVDAVWLMWPAAVVGAALAVFGSRSARPAFVGWALAMAALVAAHPIAGDGSQGRMLSAVQVIATAISVGFGIAWFRKKTVPATPAQKVLAVIVANELVSLASWLAGPFSRWSVGQYAVLLILGVIIGLQGRSLWAPKLSLSSQ